MNPKMIERAAHATDRLTRLLFRISQAMALLLLAIVVLDVIFRRLRLPLYGAMELTEAIFCVLCFFSFAYAWTQQDHIRVDIFIARAPAAARRLVVRLSEAVGVFVFGCLAYSGFNLVRFSFFHGDTTANLQLPRALPQAAMVVGAFAFCLQIIADGPLKRRRKERMHQSKDRH